MTDLDLSAGSRKRAAVAMLLLAMGASYACDGEGPLDPRSGSLTDNTYRNAFFGFTLDIPAGWSVASSETEDHIRDVGSRAVAGEDPVLKAAVEASEPIQLLTATEHPVGATVAFNPSLMVVAENVSHAPGMATGADFLFHMQSLLERSPMPYRPLGEPAEVDLDGRSYSRRDFLLSVEPGIRQSYLAAREGDYVLVFILTAHDEASLASLSETVAGIDFD